MASILIGVGVLSYDQIKKQKAKRAAQKAHNSARFAELERDNARRIDALQNKSCLCQQSDWQGGGCERHGYVPAAGMPGGPSGVEDAGPPAYGEGMTGGGEGVEVRGSDGEGGVGRGRGSGGGLDGGGGDDVGLFGDGLGTLGPMPGEEVARINEERRKKGAGGLKGWRLRKKVNEEGVWG